MAKREEPDANTVRRLLANGAHVRYRGLGKTPVAVIREVIAEPGDGVAHTFLRLAVPLDGSDAMVIERWKLAVAALFDLDLTYAWGSQKRRDRLRALARNPPILAAIQGAVAHSAVVPLDYLAVLVADGSEASYDALVPHLDAAAHGRDGRVDRLTRLRVHATMTPALRSMFAELDDILEDRAAASPALAIAPLIGLGELPMFWFHAAISSQELAMTVPRIQAHVHLDSRAARWFQVQVSAVHYLDNASSRFDHETVHADALALGRCEPADLPAWLARSATKLHIRWQVSYVSTHLRGAKRARISGWLLGEL